MRIIELGSWSGSEAAFHELHKAFDGNLSAIARECGCHRDTVRKVARDLGLTNEINEELAALSRADQKISRLEVEKQSLVKRNKELSKRANYADDLAGILGGIVVKSKMPRVKRTVSKSSDSDISFVAPFNDWHFGENIDADTVEGLNCYSPEICASRVQFVVDTIIRLKSNYSNNVSELVIPIMGDMFSGMHMIHPEVADEYAFVVKQGLDCALVTAQAIYELAREFESVRVVCPAGDNHTRLTKKHPTGKANQQCSLSTWYYDTVANLLDRCENVSFKMPKSYKATFSVRGHTYVAAHGHMMKGGGGQLGIPAYAALRLFQATQAKNNIKTMMIEDFDFPPVEHVLLGHFHTDSLIQCVGGDLRFLPALKGTDGFANDMLERHGMAASRVLACHDKYDIIGEHKITAQHIMSEDNACRYEWSALESDLPTNMIMREWVNR